jgi:hypothetical protein
VLSDNCKIKLLVNHTARKDWLPLNGFTPLAVWECIYIIVNVMHVCALLNNSHNTTNKYTNVKIISF